MTRQYNLKNIRDLLTSGFTGEELRRICHDDPDLSPVCKEFSQYGGKNEVVDKLIKYVERKELIEILLVSVKDQNPTKYEKYQPYYIEVSKIKPIKPVEQYRFLLVGALDDDPWHQVIKEVSASLTSTLQIIREVEVFILMRQHDYDLIVIDAARVLNLFLLISSIRMQKPTVKILVVTASPTWRHAREAFRAGATDYIRKSMNKVEIMHIFHQITMNSSLPL